MSGLDSASAKVKDKTFISILRSRIFSLYTRGPGEGKSYQGPQLRTGRSAPENQKLNV